MEQCLVDLFQDSFIQVADQLFPYEGRTKIGLRLNLRFREELESLRDHGHESCTGCYGQVCFYRDPHVNRRTDTDPMPMLAVKYVRPDVKMDLQQWLREAAIMYFLGLLSVLRPRYCLTDMEGIVLKGGPIKPDLFEALEDPNKEITLDELKSWIPTAAIGIRMRYVHPAVTLGTYLEPQYRHNMMSPSP